MHDEMIIPQEDQPDDLYERKSFKIDKGQEPMRIDKWLQQRIENASRNKIQQAIESGFLTVNGNTVKCNYKVRPADELILLSFVNPDHTEIQPEDRKSVV